MPRHLGWRSLAVLIVVGGAAALIATRPVQLGLDLRGGTQIVLEAKPGRGQRIGRETVDRTLEVLRRRVDQLGVSEPTLQRSGDRRIIVELPGVQDPDEAIRVIGRTAQLRFHPVVGVAPPQESPAPEVSAAPDPTGELVLPQQGGAPLRLGPAAIVGDAIADARATYGDAPPGWTVQVDFRGKGSRAFEDLTGKAACSPAGDPVRRVAIVLDEEIISSPEVSQEIGCGNGISGGQTVITGRFDQKEAEGLALLIRAGALPLPVEVVEQRTVGPTLGEVAIAASMKAAAAGGMLTVLYMIAYYRLLGGLAALALIAYGVVSFGVLLALRATLTLPGLAGFVLAIGMAVDANVLVFERIKEEHAGGRSLRSAAGQGFARAWSAIVDSNATTLIAAFLLFLFASGAVRGFGVTLTVGVAVSMFSALVVTRLLVDCVVRGGWAQSHPKAIGVSAESCVRTWLTSRHVNLLGHRRIWFAVSGVALALAVGGIAARGLSYGVEFTGGELSEYATQRRVDLDELRVGMARVGLPRAVVQQSGEGHVSVRTVRLSPADDEKVLDVVRALGGKTDRVRSEFVGPTIGSELRRKAVIALGLALAAQLVYLAVRFRWTYGASAVVAMFHDVLILIGVFAWLGKQLDGLFLASLLTVIGYSINDSVVVFDRIREERRARGREPLIVVANDACLQTIPRTINTGLGAVFILLTLYLLGGETLTDFALALLVGIVVGTYSSMFTAAPLLVTLERTSPISTAGQSRSAATRERPRRPDAVRAHRRTGGSR